MDLPPEISQSPIDTDDALIETLGDALLHADAGVREAAAKRLAGCGTQRTNGPLVAALLDTQEEVRAAAASTLRQLGWKPGNDSERAALAVAQNEFETAGRIGLPAVDALLVVARDFHVHNRLAAIETLAQIDSPQSHRLLTEALRDENEHVRCVAVQALSRLESPETVRLLAPLIQDTSWTVRSLVLDAIGSMPFPEAVDPLQIALRDEDPELRAKAAECLGSLGSSRALETLRESATGSDPERAEAARNVLENLAAARMEPINPNPTETPGDSPVPSLPILSTMLAATHRDLRQAAIESLAALADPTVVPLLVARLRDDDEGVRLAAADALESLQWQPDSPEDNASLMIIREQWEQAINLGSAAVAPLIRSLLSDDPAVCAAAAEALGRIGDKKAIAPIVDCIDDPARTVRAAASQALLVLGWEPPDDEQRARWWIELENWSDLARLGEAAVDLLVQEIENRPEDRARCDAIGSVLAASENPSVFCSLLRHARNGQVAGAVVPALLHILEMGREQLSTDDLEAAAGLTNLVQFLYEPTGPDGSPVRSGLQEVPTVQIRILAGRELGRRRLGPVTA